MVVLGFHPALSAMRYELATPLLFANVLRWVAPATFRSKEFSTQVGRHGERRTGNGRGSVQPACSA